MNIQEFRDFQQSKEVEQVEKIGNCYFCDTCYYGNVKNIELDLTK